ncbi:MAG TPA: hypothetical protein VK013_08050 [Myxococcaceae bacterium]|nr:hypothetical protein [Myxococcaceae bacterium]
MKRLFAAMLTLSLLGCGEDSRLDPEDNVTVTGRATRQDGSALAGHSAVLVKEPDLGEVLTGFTSIIGSIGLACLSEDAPELCRSARRSTTDGSGNFRFELLGKDTQGSVGQASHFNLAVRAPARSGAVAGASRTERFIIQSTELSTPELRLWEPQLTVSNDETEASVTFGALPEGASEARVAFHVPGALLWSEAYTSGATIDARLLEDAVGTVSIRTTTTGQRDEVSFEAQHVSELIAFTGRAGAPPSRDASCIAVGDSGQPVVVESCAVTDGDFVTRFEAPADPGCQPDAEGAGCESARADRSLTVDLGSERAASLVVLRGLVGEVIAEHSVDGETWSAITLDGMVGELPAATSARYVRLRSKTDDAPVLSLAELSVW